MKNIKTNNFLGRDLSRTRTEDKISKEMRSNVMSKVRSSQSKIERLVENELIIRGFTNFSKNDRSLTGTPDFVFHSERICVFIDSDFWHGWQFPRWKHLLKNDFWRDKIQRNRDRDKKVTRFLRKSNWTVIRIWEHNLYKDLDKEIQRITLLLKNQSA